MNREILTLLVLAGFLSGSFQLNADEHPSRPNILLIMADDLGFSDLGCYGGEIHTPNLDRLATQGVRFSQFYNTARCWPTRAALLTGYYPQQVRRDDLPGIKKGNRPSWAQLLPQRLKKQGYRSYHSGKWHLDGKPVANGFDHSYLLQDQGRFFYPQLHWKNDRKLPPVKRTENPFGDGFYGTTAIADHAIDCLQDHQLHHRSSPFFHYLAFTAPHFPLHALPEDIQKYEEVYRAGWDEIRQRRWERISQLPWSPGTLSNVEYDLGPPYHFPQALKKLGPGEINRPKPWLELTPDQKVFQSKKMAIHAAMVDRMDQEIGRVLAQLKKMQALDNTLILFLSDNGASAEIMVRDDGHDPQAPPGSGKTYLCLGPGWSTVANTPFRRHKTWVHEGGIRTPLIMHWPRKREKNFSKPGRFRLKNSEWIHRPGHVVDIVPTLMEIAGIAATEWPKQPPLAGESIWSGLTIGQQQTQAEKRVIWWSHEGNRAVRSGPFKLVAAKSDNWSLYDLRTDPTEQNDLADKQPDRVRELSQRWEQQQQSFIRLHKSGQ